MGFIRGIGPLELGILLVIMLVVFGAGKLPEAAGTLGKAIKSFRKEVTEPKEDIT